MILEDKILRICSGCQLVELEDNVLLPKDDARINELVENGYRLSHDFLSRKCAQDFHGDDLVDIKEAYVPGRNENGNLTYETCQ
ncbi:hypothetical protein HOA91_03060 [Candidatus Woesearchaeota archaeon]|jgi:hypothetical protein|nr:hypothetical protein [Candidatus Woesearchaeota archaeon]